MALDIKAWLPNMICLQSFNFLELIIRDCLDFYTLFGFSIVINCLITYYQSKVYLVNDIL